MSRFQRSLIYILTIILFCTVLYFLPETKDNVIVDADRSLVNNVSKHVLNNEKKQEANAEETNENHVLEEPGNELGANGDLNQIGIPPSFDKHDNGVLLSLFCIVFG